MGLNLAGFCRAIFSLRAAITLVIILTLCILVMRGGYIPSEFFVIATAIATYYFCRDSRIDERMAEHEKNFH